MSPKNKHAKQASQAIRTAAVPQHRVVEAGLRAARDGLGTLAGGLAVYYAVITLYRGVFSPADIRNILVVGCAGTALAFAGLSAYLRSRVIPLSSVWPYSTALISLVVANMGLYQILHPTPDALHNFGMLNVVVAVLAVNRRVVLSTVLLSTSAWAMATVIQPVPNWGNDATYLLTTWVLAYGLHLAQMASLTSQEALRLRVEMSLDASERRLDQRNRALTALRASQKSLHKVVDKNPECVLIVQTNHVVYANRAFLRRVGLTSDKVMGVPFPTLVAEEDRDLADTQLLLGDPDGIELHFAAANGESIATEITAVEVSFAEHPAVMLVSKDLVSDEEANEEREALAHRMLAVGTLAAGVAHEINNPLAYVMTNLEMLQAKMHAGEPSSAEEQAALVAGALEGAGRVRDIVTDLRTFSRQDEDRTEPIDIHTLLETSIRMAWNEIRHRAELVREYKTTPTVVANPAKLGQVFLNLLVNAAQAIEDGDASGHRIWVRTGSNAGRVFIEIRDTGVGMTEPVMNRMFEPFYTTKPIGVGTGLGLAFCRDVISELDGVITVDSKPGDGTSFRITLPASDEAPTPEPAPAALASRTGHAPRKILVIDDEEALAEAICAVLGQDDVTLVTSGIAGLAAMKDQTFDAILCDIMMPEMSGPDVYERMRAEYPEELSKIGFMTGGTFTEVTRTFLDHTAAPVLSKPFRAKALRALVDQLTKP